MASVRKSRAAALFGLIKHWQSVAPLADEMLHRCWVVFSEQHFVPGFLFSEQMAANHEGFFWFLQPRKLTPNLGGCSLNSYIMLNHSLQNKTTARFTHNTILSAVVPKNPTAEFIQPTKP